MPITIKDILARSHKATCAVMEREIVTKPKNTSQIISKLKNKGFFVIGKSFDKNPRVWFIRRGGF